MIPGHRLAWAGMRGTSLARSLMLVLVLAVGACQPSAPPTPHSVPAGSVTSPVIGVPIHIDAEGFSAVRAFTLRTDAGQEILFRMGTLENGAAFPPNHLSEHLAGSTPVRVFFREEGGERVAYRIEDQPAP